MTASSRPADSATSANRSTRTTRAARTTQRPSPTRRSVIRAAWSAPVVVAVAAAPAYATTGCTRATIIWAGFEPGTVIRSASAGGVTMVVTLTDVVGASPGSAGVPANGKIFGQPLGGVPTCLGFSLDAAVANARQTINLTFSQEVRELTLPWLDVDTGGDGRHVERLSVLTPGWTASGVGPGVTQAGSNFTGNRSVPNNATGGNLTLTWAAPITSVALRFSEQRTVAGASGIGLGDVSFTVCC